MRKSIWQALGIILVLALVMASLLALAGCSSSTTTTTTPPQTSTQQPTSTLPPTSTQPPTSATTSTSAPTSTKTTTAPPTSTSPTTPAAQITKGGTLTVIMSSGPRVLSYYPEMGPGDETAVLPAEEKLMEYQSDHQLHPFLADSVTVAPDGTTITFKIKQGIKFTDGSDLNAQVVVWNYQRAKDSGKLQYKDKLLGVAVLDPYTVVLKITGYDNQLLSSFGWVPIFSQAAWNKAGGDGSDAAKNWARANVVGTGPFMLTDFKVDDHMTWVKNPNYWQPGKPYLDGLVYKFIPDSVTASAIMQAGQADEWDNPQVRDLAFLGTKGFTTQGSSGNPITIYPNIKDPTSKSYDVKVRQAVEYAIDKAAISKALGFGYYTPMQNSVAADMSGGYDPSYIGREYNVQKAKDLLASAGYPNGLKITLSALVGWEDQAQAIKQYLDDAGFQVNIDMADAGRFFSMMWGGVGWPDLLLFLQASMPNTMVCLQRTLGPQPMSQMASWVLPPELAAIFNQARLAMSDAEQDTFDKQIVNYLSDKALLTPLWEAPSKYLIKPYVHTTYQQETVVQRFTADDWMEKH